MDVLAQLTCWLFVGLLLWAAVSDLREFIIPNRVCAAIALLFIPHLIFSPVPVNWIAGGAFAAVLFLVGAFAFSRGWAGGGDVKLLAAVGLWSGDHMLAFLYITAVVGGVMGMLTLAYRTVGRWAFSFGIHSRLFAPSFSEHPVLPYGVAIAAGGIYVAATLLTGK